MLKVNKVKYMSVAVSGIGSKTEVSTVCKKYRQQISINKYGTSKVRKHRDTGHLYNRFS